MNIVVRKAVRAYGSITVSGDKSISHRALLLGAVARGTTVIRGWSQGRDCGSTLMCLQNLGIDIAVHEDRIEVNGAGLDGLCEPVDVLDCGNSGTTMRLLAGLLCGQRFVTVLTGDGSLRNRPMQRVIEPLTAMHAHIISRSRGRAPLVLQGNALQGIEYTLPIASAQVKSAVLLAGMYAQGSTTVIEPLKSRDHTERMMIDFGVDLKRSGNAIVVKPGALLNGQEVHVPGDISSAAFFIVLGCIMPDSDLVILKTGVNPTRSGILDAMRSMGARIVTTVCNGQGSEPVADLGITHAPLSAVDIHGAIIPRLIDELPIIAVAATQARGVSRIHGAAELRHKETDRIQAIVQELQKMGASIQEHEDGFSIKGPCDLRGAVCSCHHDHRIAMALAIAGLIADGETVIKDAECIDISFPEFTTLVRSMCGEDAIQAAA